MNELAIFISPSKEVYEFVTEWKSKFKKEFGNQLYLDHPPHITIANFFAINEQKIIEKLSECCKKSKQNINLEINEISEFLNDPITHKFTPYLSIKYNKRLETFQQLIINQIRSQIKSKFITDFENNLYNLNIKKYKYPFVGKDWMPHVTIGSFGNEYLNSELRKKFLSEKIKFEFVVESISVFKITQNKHIKLKDVII